MKTQKLNCKKARNISIVKTLKNLGHFPKKETEKEAWFLSPFRSETQASFKVDLRLNRWYDHGAGKGGNIIDLIMALYKLSVPKTLDFLSGNINSFSFQQQSKNISSTNDKKTYNILSVKSLKSNILINYLKSRKVDINIAKTHCQEIYYKLDNKTYFAIAFKNKSGGFETRNKYFKGVLGNKDYTIVNNQSKQVFLFEGFMDFLSYLTLYSTKISKENYIILNSIALIEKAILHLKNYDKIYTCFDNDKAGEEAAKKVKLNYKNSINCSFIFEGYKDLNAYLCDNSSKEASRTGAIPLSSDLPCGAN